VERGRLGRSLQHLLGFLGELKAKGVDLYLHQQGLDTAMPAGKALFQMLGVFAAEGRGHRASGLGRPRRHHVDVAQARALVADSF
jgi:DNA invertase Pin-like site-specific DNA recombinase